MTPLHALALLATFALAMAWATRARTLRQMAAPIALTLAGTFAVVAMLVRL